MTATTSEVADPPIPGLYLDLAAMETNVAVMQRWCAEAQAHLAPHIKTTMTREIVLRQLAAGAWGVSVATARQAELGAAWGARRVVVANEVVLPRDLHRLAALASATDAPEVYLFVDSVDGAAAAGAASRTSHPLRLLVDLGVPGGRTGVRSEADAVALAEYVARTHGVVLTGVAAYEGILTNDRDEATLAAIDRHCRASLALLERVRALLEVADPVFTMGGSAFPDRVVGALARHRTEDTGPITTVLRSGCYVTHDHGTYAQVSPIIGLQAALRVRAAVCSVPEPGCAVVAAGRRELPSDAGLPVLLTACSPDRTPRTPLRGTAVRMFDHHLVLTEVEGLHVGDVVELGISHPCSAFDRWPGLTVLGPDGEPIASWRTEFR